MGRSPPPSRPLEGKKARLITTKDGLKTPYSLVPDVLLQKLFEPWIKPSALQFEIPFQVLVAAAEARAVFTEAQVIACTGFREKDGYATSVHEITHHCRRPDALHVQHQPEHQIHIEGSFPVIDAARIL